MKIGKRIVFGSYDPERTDVWMVSVEGGELKQVAHGYDPIYSPDGKFIYFASFGKNLNFGVSKVALAERGEPVGEPVEIVGAGLGRYKRLTISADGKKLAYGTLAINSNIWSIPISGKDGRKQWTTCAANTRYELSQFESQILSRWETNCISRNPCWDSGRHLRDECRRR